MPGLLENMPYMNLFNAKAPLPQGPEFRQFYPSQIATLAIPDINGFYQRLPDQYLMHESFPEDNMTFDAGLFYRLQKDSPDDQAFAAAIAAEVKRVGSGISVDDVFARTLFEHCHRCHVGNQIPAGDGIRLPLGFGAQHIGEERETVDGVTRFRISAALRDVFAPNRAKILTDFLAGKPLPVHSN